MMGRNYDARYFYLKLLWKKKIFLFCYEKRTRVGLCPMVGRGGRGAGAVRLRLVYGNSRFLARFRRRARLQTARNDNGLGMAWSGAEGARRKATADSSRVLAAVRGCKRLGMTIQSICLSSQFAEGFDQGIMGEWGRNQGKGQHQRGQRRPASGGSL